jgi:DNA-directed RNA polymerase specialized sigma24 family protein
LKEAASQKKSSTLAQEPFDRLLAWLDSDREYAGRKYEEIRYKLIKFFTCHGCTVPEELADRTIDRVANKMKVIAESYVGEPALYFYGVARNIYLEYLKKNSSPLPRPVLPEPVEDVEQVYACLDQCLGQLPPDGRELILEYYQGDRGVKIEQRKELAGRLGIPVNALRIRAHRIRVGLQECMRRCVEQQQL